MPAKVLIITHSCGHSGQVRVAPTVTDKAIKKIRAEAEQEVCRACASAIARFGEGYVRGGSR